MELPQIVEDDRALQAELAELIHQRYQLSAQDSRFNFQMGELQLVKNSATNDSMAKTLYSLLQAYLKNRVDNAYCYYTLNSILEGRLQPQSQLTAITEETRTVTAKTSQYHKINHLILMRQILLGKLQGGQELSKEMWQYVEDTRFITEEVINAIRAWKKSLKERGTSQNVLFIYKNYNYITKIIIDNSQIINTLNKQIQTFCSIPNPLFLLVNAKTAGMSVETVNVLNQILSEQKAQELKMMLQSPHLKALKNIQLQKELKELKKKIQINKVDQIRTIYQPANTTGKGFTSASRAMATNQERVENIVSKNQISIHSLDQLIQQKQLQVLKELKKKKVVAVSTDKREQKEGMRSGIVLGYKSKLDSLRSQIEKNVKLDRQRLKKKEIPKAEADLRSSKPKIKLVLQRQTLVDNVGKGVFQMIQGDRIEPKLVRSRSTFYKQMQIDVEGGGQQKELLRKSDRNIMISSAYSFKSLAGKQKGRSTSVNFKLRKSSAKRAKREEKDVSRSREEQIGEVNDSLAMLSSKIREQSIKNIYSQKQNKSKVTVSIQPSQQRSSNIKKSHIGQRSQMREERFAKFEIDSGDPTVEERLKEKQDHIRQLRQKLKALKSNHLYKWDEPVDPLLQDKKSVEGGVLKVEMQRLELQNIRIKQEMKLQEMKYLELKEKEFKLKEEEVEHLYKRKMDKVREQLLQKQKQFQLKIKQEQEKNQQMEVRFQEATKQSEHIQIQLQEKKIKEQLFSELILEETARQQKYGEEKEQQERNRAILDEFSRQQQHYKRELQVKAMEVFEQEKLQLRALHLDIQRKNQELEQQNIKKQEEVRQLEAQTLREEEELQRLQTSLQQRDKEAKLAIHLASQIPLTSQDVEPKLDPFDLSQLKDRVKLQLMGQIMKMRQKEQQEEREYQQTRRKHMLELQEEMRKALTLEDDEFHKIDQEYKTKNEEMVKEFQQQIEDRRQQKQLIEQQSQKRIQDAQYQESPQRETLFNVETGLEAKQEEANIQQNNYQLDGEGNLQEQNHPIKKNEKPSEIPEQTLSTEKHFDVVKSVEQLQSLPIKETNIQRNQLVEESEKPQIAKVEERSDIVQILEKQQISSVPERQQIVQVPAIPQVSQAQQSIKPVLQSEMKEYIQNEGTSNVVQQSQRPSQAVKQNVDEIKSKYERLLSSVSKPRKQIYFPLQQLEGWIDKYYSGLQVQVKEMLALSRKQVQGMFRSKRVDVFDDLSFGWYRPKQKKFILMGSWQVIPIIGGKYGEIQVQQVFIFNKGKVYQKQFLSKLIKVYEKIGYIYQKKTNQQNHYSIKFIVKVPPSINRNLLNDHLDISTSLVLSEHADPSPEDLKSNCLHYLLTQALAELLSQKEKVELAGSQGMEQRYLSNKMAEEPFNSPIVSTDKMTDRIAEVRLSIPINYLHTDKQSFYTLKAKQYQLSTSQEKTYVSILVNQMLAIVVFKMQPQEVPPQFHLDRYLEAKLKKITEAQKEVRLFLPLWKNNISFRAQGASPRPYCYRQQTQPNLFYGSVVSTRAQKGSFISLEAPFAFVVVELNSMNVLRRILYGHIVVEQEVVRTERDVSHM